MRALACASGGAFVHEPDNIDTRAPILGAGTRLGFGPYPVLEPGAAAPHYAALWDLAFQGRRALQLRRGLGRRMARTAFRLPRRARDPLLAAATRGLRLVATPPRIVVVSSVMAHFAAEWIQDRFQPRVIVLQRDPLNVASSWLRLDVTGYDIHARPAIVDGKLLPLGVARPLPGATRVALVGWWIGALAEQLRALTDRNPDWLVVTHEQLCEDADSGYREIYRQLRLTWTEAIDRYLGESGYVEPIARGGRRDFTAPLGDDTDAAVIRKQQVHAWQDRLTPAQVSELREALAPFPHRGWVRAPGTPQS